MSKEEIAQLRLQEWQEALKATVETPSSVPHRAPIKSIESFIEHLKKKNLIDLDTAEVLRSLDATESDLVGRTSKSTKGPLSETETYSPELQMFALNLYFYSQAAYLYARHKFDTCLPHPRIISKWYQNSDGEPGFTAQSFELLKQKSQKTQDFVVCSLIMDEMVINRHSEWVNEKFYGFVDLGLDDCQNDCAQEANSVLVLLLVSLKERWKIPIGYFFYHSMNGEQRASLLRQCLYKCYNSGVEVVSLTMDGSSPNKSMATILGCRFEPSVLKTTFKHPVANHQVAVLFDPCYLLNLVKHAFRENQIVIDYQGKEVKWSYLDQLTKYAKSKKLDATNKLKNTRSVCQSQKFRVELATELLSRSLADILTVCEKSDKSFERVQPTVNFIRLINDLFDFLNPRDSKYKIPVSPKNINQVMEFLNNAKRYIMQLTTKRDNDFVKFNRRAGFVGLLVSIESTIFLYNRLVETNKVLDCLMMQKFSLDQLGLFFSIIRAYSENIYEPTARQTKLAYDKILVKTGIKKPVRGNCIPLEDVNVLNMPSIQIINTTADKYRMLYYIDQERFKDKPIPVHVFFNLVNYLNLTMFDNLHRVIVTYISEYVIRFVSKELKCEKCFAALYADRDKDVHFLIKIDDKTGLIPSDDIINICLLTEYNIKIIKPVIEMEKKLTMHDKHKIIFNTMKSLIGQNCFNILDDHINEHTPLNNHITHLSKYICEKYIEIRFKYFSNFTNVTVDPKSKMRKFVRSFLF